MKKIYLDKILYPKNPKKIEELSENELKEKKRAKKLRNQNIALSEDEAVDNMFKDIKKERKTAKKAAREREASILFGFDEPFDDPWD